MACSKQQPIIVPGIRDAVCFAMADFGCACAWSTINSMHFMAKCVAGHQLGNPNSPSNLKVEQQLHFQAFFNDLASNDFNTLFTLLSSSQGPATQAAGFHFMACGLPGSFYSRLFPSGSLHFGLCTLALHNLSQVPEAVQDPNSPAFNENGVWILQGCKTETTMAYKHQFHKDFTCFLQHRSQELVAGGLLFCVMIAASSADATSTLPKGDRNHLYTNLQVAWRQLISEGLLEQNSLDAFNLPIFLPTIDQVEEVVCGDVELRTELEVMEVQYVEIERAPAHVWMESAAADAQTWGRTCETMLRNFVGSLGSEKFELLMGRLRHVAAADDELYRSSTMSTNGAFLFSTKPHHIHGTYHGKKRDLQFDEFNNIFLDLKTLQKEMIRFYELEHTEANGVAIFVIKLDECKIVKNIKLEKISITLMNRALKQKNTKYFSMQSKKNILWLGVFEVESEDFDVLNWVFHQTTIPKVINAQELGGELEVKGFGSYGWMAYGRSFYNP
ncbi:hypothetical protein L7F22_018428 [Adiantum nelumboides]|nr:hypothetical protein [Adiantum nelumboides]